jgi:hypothetical protein
VYFGKAGTLVDISAGMSSALCSADTSAQAAPHANGAWDKSLRFVLCGHKTQQQYKAEPYRVTFLDKDNEDFHYHGDSGAVAHLNTLKTPFPANYCAAWSPRQKVWYLLYRKGAEVQKEVERLFPEEMARAKAANDKGQQKRAKK